MYIVVSIKNKTIKLSLMDENVIKDSILISDEHKLSEEMLPAIDELLKKNGIAVKDVEKMALDSDLGENFTTHRIALTVVKAFNWTRAVDN